MAMLAEPRRKQKWSVDPRNSTWSNDETKFGQKMLEKMGWSKGKGLGAQEQGSTEHVKVQLKNNTLGLGATSNHEDNWISHQDDFNQLLAELNDCHGTGSAASSDNENKKSFSLEEKSKSSKKRVHYMKFAKGKDLSSRSDTDLACIFGKREKVKKSPQEKTDSEPEESASTSPSHTNEVESENTVISSLSVNEYFAKRMAELKKSHAKREERVAEPCLEDDGENYSEDTQKKSKKKKRRKNNDDCPEEPKESGNPEDENDVDTTQCQERRRKPKSKKEDKVLTAENPEDHEEEDDQNKTLRRKKKKNKRKKESCDERQTEEVTSTPDEDIDAVQPKKKRKKGKRERTET